MANEVFVAKNTRGVKEFTREQRLAKENIQLKRELSYLRKQISRLDLEGLEAAKQALFDREEKERISEDLGDSNSNLEQLKKTWKCNSCQNGWLEITTYHKAGETWYYRRCSDPACKKRTVGQRYNEQSVRGILKK
jgi:hypothetical protein